MRKVILNLAVSLDGYIAGPNGEYDWCFTDQDYGIKEFTQTIDATLMGRKTYEVLIKEGQETFMGMKNYVFSKSLKQKDYPGITVISDHAESFIRDLKKTSGKNLWLFGGGELIQFLLEINLVDELMLSIHPILLGSGIPLFHQSSERTSLKLIESKAYESGLIQLNYEL